MYLCCLTVVSLKVARAGAAAGLHRHVSRSVKERAIDSRFERERAMTDADRDRVFDQAPASVLRFKA